MKPFILIVEDEEKLARLLSDYLDSAGFETATVSDGRHVIDHVKQRRPDLVLLDLMLPGRRGLDVFRDIRAEMDLVVVVSNCPQINNPCNGFNPTPVRMVIAG